MNIGISEKNRSEVAKLLSYLLADEYVLYTKTWKFHWNVEGPHFGSLHEFFDKQVAQLAKNIDAVAERIRALGLKSDGTLTEFLEKTSLPEHPGENPNDLGMIKLLLDDHEEIIRRLHEHIAMSMELGDPGTNNFLCELIEDHEKMAWMLRAFLG